jgi:ribosomal protein S18 acetylase RimI-like enzyme
MDAAADVVTIRPFERADTAAVLAVWRDAFPNYSAPARRRIAIRCDRSRLKFATQPAVLRRDLRRPLVGTLMAGFDGHRGWLYSFGVANDARRLGIVARCSIMPSAPATRLALKINLRVLPGNDDAYRFYAALGYRVEERITFGKALPAPDGTGPPAHAGVSA